MNNLLTVQSDNPYREATISGFSDRLEQAGLLSLGVLVAFIAYFVIAFIFSDYFGKGRSVRREKREYQNHLKDLESHRLPHPYEDYAIAEQQLILRPNGGADHAAVYCMDSYVQIGTISVLPEGFRPALEDTNEAPLQVEATVDEAITSLINADQPRKQRTAQRIAAKKAQNQHLDDLRRYIDQTGAK